MSPSPSPSDPLACVALQHREAPEGVHSCRLLGIGFAELWSSQPQVFDQAYLLVTQFESEMADGPEACRELQAEGYFVERLGGACFLCRGDGMAVLQDLRPSVVEFFRVSGPMSREDFRRLRVTHGRPRPEEDFFRAVGASLYVSWSEASRGLVRLADEELVDELLLFTLQIGLFGQERLLSARERGDFLTALRPLLLQGAVLIERSVVHAGGDVDAVVLSWFPEGEEQPSWEVDALAVRVREDGELDLGNRRPVHLLAQLGWLRYGSLRFGLPFTALFFTVLLVAFMLLGARLWTLGWRSWPITLLVAGLCFGESWLWSRISGQRVS